MNAAVEEALRQIVAEEVRRALQPVVEMLRSNGQTGGGDLMTGDELAEMLKVDRRTLRRLVLEGEVPPPITIGARTQRWRRSTIEKWLRKREQRP